MLTISTINQEKFITYNKHYSNKNKVPYVIFLHGLMSNMDGSKAVYFEEYCIKNSYNFIKFDNFGHGKSSGEFVKENISSWLEGLNLIIEQLTDGSIILVGSSAGAWISLLGSLQHKSKILGIICISAAPDFTEELIWKNLSNQERTQLHQNGIINVRGSSNDCNYSYPITYDLILNGRKHLLLNQIKINITCPVHLIHGMQDIDVSYSFSLQLAEKIISKQITIKLIKNGDHRLTRPQDLIVISNSLEEIINLLSLKDSK